MASPLIKTIDVVLPVFSVIGVGYLFAHFRKISLDPVIDILLYLTIPALVVSSLIKSRFATGDLAAVALCAVVVVLGTGIMARIFLTLTKRRSQRGFYLPVMFMNSGNMAFPLSLLAFGPDGLAVAVIFYVVISLMVYSLGIYIAKGSGGLGEIFRLPLIYAAVVGVAVNLSGAHVPGPVISALGMLGAATIPIMQISLGYRLYSARLTDPWVSIAGSVIRIAGGLAIAWVAVSAFGIDGMNRKVILLASAMPSAVINFIISQKYRTDGNLVASTVATSTFISIFTTPLVLMWILD